MNTVNSRPLTSKRKSGRGAFPIFFWRVVGYCSQDSDMLPAGHVIFALLSASGTAQREGLGGGALAPPPFLQE